MKNPFLLIFMIIVAVILAFFYLNNRPADIPENLENANKADRCAEYRQTIEGEDEDLYSIGYGGRIKQLLRGCF